MPTPAPTVAPSSPFDAVIEQSYAGGWVSSSPSTGTALSCTRTATAYLWHDGAIGGFQTVNATFPDDGIDIVILTNDGTGLDPYYVVPDVFRLALTSSATQSRSSARTRTGAR
jgi:hypothetical protein